MIEVRRFPDKMGHFGIFGGRYVPETLMCALEELEFYFKKVIDDKTFQEEFRYYIRKYAGRPTPLYFAERMSKDLSGPRIYLKREDLCHTGSHKINNTIGQVLLARRMGKKRIIAETGAGQHGVATATAAALFGLECVVYMGEEDVHRQALNVFRMKLLGAEVRPVRSGSRTLKDAINETLRDWVTNVQTTYYVIGSIVGPHPYPVIVREFQSIIGKEVKEQILMEEGRYPDCLIACVGGGSNSMGLFYPFIEYSDIELIGVEAGGLGLDSGKHGASLSKGEVGVLHGAKTYILQDRYGQIWPTHSVAAGLDYPGVGPELAYLKDIGRIKVHSVTDEEALRGFVYLSEKEGIIPALESAHAVAYAVRELKNKDKIVVINLSGRGDKDVQLVEQILKERK